MENFGAYLKQEREARETSLDEVARVTRISKRFLVALEEGRTEDLPELTFVRGFLRAYAEAVGMDGSALVLRYEAEVLSSTARRRPRVDWRRWVMAGAAALGVAALVAVLLARTPVQHRDDEPAPRAEPRPAAPAVPPLRPPAMAPAPPSPSLTPGPPAATAASEVPETREAVNPLADLVGLAPDDEAGTATP